MTDFLAGMMLGGFCGFIFGMIGILFFWDETEESIEKTKIFYRGGKSYQLVEIGK